MRIVGSMPHEGNFGGKSSWETHVWGRFKELYASNQEHLGGGIAKNGERYCKE